MERRITTMKPLDLEKVCLWVNDNIDTFHDSRINSLNALSLKQLLSKNPYLLRAKNVTTAGELISGSIEAFLSSSEEESFGAFLEDLAFFVAELTCGGHKSTAPGVDLEFINDQVHYVVSIKSGTNWGNSSQQDKLEENLKDAVKRVKMSHRNVNVQPVLGICYGKTRTSYVRGYLKIVGQNFWYLISGNQELYKDIIQPIGYRAREHNDKYLLAKSPKINILTQEFLADYTENGLVDSSYKCNFEGRRER
jgi:hypothetical protein